MEVRSRENIDIRAQRVKLRGMHQCAKCRVKCASVNAKIQFVGRPGSMEDDVELCVLRSSSNRSTLASGSSAWVCTIILSSMRRLTVALVFPLRRKNRPWFACNRATANNSASGRRAMPRSCKHASRIERRSLSWTRSSYSEKKDVEISWLFLLLASIFVVSLSNDASQLLEALDTIVCGD